MEKIKLSQEGYTKKSFVKSVSKECKDIGFHARIVDGKWVWELCIEKYDVERLWSKLGEDFPEDTKNLIIQIEKNLVRQVTFTDLISAIDLTIKSNIKNTSQETYSFEGDVWSVGCSENNLFLELIDNFEERWKKIHVYGRIDNKKIDIDAFRDSRVRVTGKLSVYRGVLQITANNIDRIGDCSRIKQIEKWREENQNLLKRDRGDTQEVKYFDIVNIGLIATEGNHGYNDFISKLYKPLRNKLKPKYIEKINTINDIINAIKEYNAEENKCSCICIVRGGGDSNYLIDYSRPELLQAIYDSKIKIITGIAHAGDELLCDYVADYAAITPTDAADYLNHVYNKRPNKSNADTKENTKISYKSFSELQSENFELNYQVDYLRSQLKVKDNEIKDKDNEIKKLEQQLNAKNNKGFFSRFFG